MESRSITRVAAATMAIALSVVLTACGGGNDNSEPTATTAPSNAQPTVETTAVSTPAIASPPASAPAVEVPANTDMSSPGVGMATPSMSVAGTATPATVAAAVLPGSPPSTPGSSMLATPEASAEATIASAQGTPVNGTTSDGTSGAASRSTTGSATPSSPATPVSGATPAVSATPRAATKVPVVTSCNVENVPKFTGDTTTYVLTVDLNFRDGPGSDCDIIGDGPLGEFSVVDVTGGPVKREGDESGEWVQVRVGDQVGWLALEYLKPAE